VELIRQAESIESQAAPHLAALKEIEGMEFYGLRRRSIDLRVQAERMLVHAEALESKQPEPVRAQLLAQRDVSPSDIDRQIYAFRYPAAVEEQATS
jgi:hypothetical protein